MDEMKNIGALPEKRFEVVHADQGHWRMGTYLPEAVSPGEVAKLEKHSCPELFLCMGAKTGLVLRDEKGERLVEMLPGQSLMVEGYHNGYRIDPGGFFLVVERTEFTTEYVDRVPGTTS